MSMTNIESMKQNNAILWWKGDVSSANAPKSITPYGGCKQLLPFSGAGIGMFDGTGDYLVVTDSTDLNIGSSDFTLQAYAYCTNITTDARNIFGDQDGSGGTIYTSYMLQILPTSGIVRFAAYNSSGTIFVDLQGTTNVYNSWHHIAVTRSGSSWKLFVDGNVEATTTSSDTVRSHNASAQWFVGALQNSSENFRYYFGYISELALHVGIAKHTSNFTPPRRQLESDSNTKLLLHFNRNDTTFVDSSPSAHTITRYGDAKQLCSPVGSGVAYFDGTGDYLSIPSSTDWAFGTGDFTIYCAVYIFSFPTNTVYFIDRARTSDTTSIITIYMTTTGGIRAGLRDLTTVSPVRGYVSGGNIITNDWNHILYVRKNNVFGLYLNGTLTNQITDNFDHLNSTKPLTIGTWIGASNGLNGYISTVLIKKGMALADPSLENNISIPTQPFKPDPYTKLLLHMDGTGNAFYDSSDPPGDNGFPILPDGVTVTPTGTFTTQKMKDGRNVWKFDGSTNYITISDHASWSMFLNDFTIAGWVKFDSVAANKVIIGQYTDANNQWYLQWTTGNIIQLYGITSSTARFDFSCPLAAVANTWYHIVVQRSGSSCIMYINGVAQTVTQTTAFSATATDIAAVLSIGKINTGYQTGNIKDLQMFTKALTMDQISALYQETYIY